MSRRSNEALAQSVKQRLLNLSAKRGETFNILLVRYGIERLLYRLTQSPHRERFVLKGATLFAVWTGKPHRPTQDLDLLGFGAPATDRLEAVFREICLADVEPDGLEFDHESVSVQPIREDNIYDGLRVRLLATLGSARISLQVDVGFGDVITPAPRELPFGSLLDLPAPVLRTYPPETVVAEKLDAIVKLGMGNSRMKDYFDLWTLSETMTFEFAALHQAVTATLERRSTPMPTELPIGLSDEFSSDPTKEAQWSAFLRKMGTGVTAPALPVIVARIRDFALPLFDLAGASASFDKWPPPGPWSSAG